jgi:signal peptidase I
MASFLLDIVETIVVAMAIFVVCYLFFFGPHQVIGASMEPNFYDQELILTDKISYRFHTPQRGDVIIFRSPKNRELDYIKRIVGLPGERVKVENGAVYINDQQLKEDYLAGTTATSSGPFLREDTDFSVPDDEYLVFGDNRINSSDSREWGTINKEDIIGRAWLRYWPPSVLGVLASPQY